MRISDLFQQAKESLKILETLEKETLSKVRDYTRHYARNYIRIPSRKERAQMTNERILSSLKKVGIASSADLDELSQKIDRLEASLHKKTRGNQGDMKRKKGAPKMHSHSKAPSAQANQKNEKSKNI